MKKTLSPLIVLILVTACATTLPEPTSTPLPPTEPPPTPLPEPTNTSIPPTQVPQPTNTSIPPTQIPQLIEVTFDGTGCTVIGPTEVPVGLLTSIFIDQSDLIANVSLWVVSLDDGKTTQDMIHEQPEPGVWWPKASWVHHEHRRSSKAVESDDGRVVSTTWYLPKVAEHTLICMWYPQILWIAGSIMVVEAPSE